MIPFEKSAKILEQKLFQLRNLRKFSNKNGTIREIYDNKVFILTQYILFLGPSLKYRWSKVSAVVLLYSLHNFQSPALKIELANLSSPTVFEQSP